MKIIFCLSHMSTAWTLQLIEFYNDDNFLIVTNNASISLFFRKIYSDDYVVELYPLGRIISKKINITLKNFSHLIRNKKIAKDRIFKYKNPDIYFFFPAYGFFETWIINHFRKTSIIYYKPDVNLNLGVKDGPFISLIKSLDLVLFYNSLFDTYKNQKYFCVNEKFIEMKCIRDFYIPEDIKEITTKVNEVFNLKEKKILLLCGGTVEYDFVFRDNYINQIDTLIEYLISKYGINSISIKCHPRFDKKYGLENEIEEIPNYFPGSLLVSLFDVVIGYNSALLYEFANFGKKAISTMDYFANKNIDKSFYKNYFCSNLKNDFNVDYFKTIDDLTF